MNAKTLKITFAAVAALAAVGGGAWWLGMSQGMAMMAAPEAVAAATADPSQWTIPQGEEATRRHIRDGLKAGDVDPATGLRIQNYHDPMVPGKNFDAPAKSPFMDMMLVPCVIQPPLPPVMMRRTGSPVFGSVVRAGSLIFCCNSKRRGCSSGFAGMVS